ncbi:MAG: hypothetical protein LUF33_00130 [Clostridiales bacterium]|nr:hypothetical protein [Clostridiales bacterium]
MKLFVKRDTSDEDSGFTVFDESGYEKYYVIFKNSRTFIKLNITDTQKNITAKIRQILTPPVLAFSINANGKNLLLIISKSKNGVNCLFYGVNWHICGDAATKNFSILDVDNTVLASHKKLFECGKESYELEIFDSSNELFCIGACVCIDLMNSVDNLAVQTV